MDKERLESLLIDYIDNRLAPADRALIEAELSANAEARKLYTELSKVIHAIEASSVPEPADSLRNDFDSILNREIAAADRGRFFLFRPVYYRVAAAISLMVLSTLLGFWIIRYNEQQDRLAAMEEEMEAARQQLAETRSVIFGMLENKLSASQRIRGVNVAMEIAQPDDEVVDALMETMLGDPNTNVRLAALDALARFQQEPAVRKQLINALSRQTDPIVQIRLIQLMVHMREKEVVDDLQQIINDSETMKAVKDEAYNGILKLS